MSGEDYSEKNVSPSVSQPSTLAPTPQKSPLAKEAKGEEVLESRAQREVA